MAEYDHNRHYQGLVLDQVPAHCAAALDIGCGSGDLARQLANRSALVVGLDRDGEMIDRARRAQAGAGVTFLEGDFLVHDFGGARFDFLSAVASLHHMDFDRALERCAGLLRPGGVLTVLGLYRESGPIDLAWALAAVPVNSYLAARGSNQPAEAPAPIRSPEMTLPEIRRTAKAVLPGARIRRLLLWRYLLTWRPV